MVSTYQAASGLRSHLVFRPSADRAFRIPCDLMDLNASGCALRYALPRALPKSSASTMLEIENLAAGGTIQMLARVCWSKQTGLGQFSSGLHFRRRLPDEYIWDGVGMGQLSRRAAKRRSVYVPVSVRQQQPYLRAEATIISSSQTGMQIIGSDPMAVGSRLMLQLQDGTSVDGKTVWCSARDAEYASGVAFTKAATGRVFDASVVRMSGAN